MEISKNNIFKVRYTSVLENNLSKQKKWTSQLAEFLRNRKTKKYLTDFMKKNGTINFIKRNKIISLTLTLFTMCVIVNMILIYNFVKVLQLL